MTAASSCPASVCTIAVSFSRARRRSRNVQPSTTVMERRTTAPDSSSASNCRGLVPGGHFVLSGTDPGIRAVQARVGREEIADDR